MSSTPPDIVLHPAAATSAMHTLTGVEGRYDRRRHTYDPPAPFRTWGDVVRERGLRLVASNNVSVLRGGRTRRTAWPPGER